MRVIICEDRPADSLRIQSFVENWVREREIPNLEIKLFSSSEDLLEDYENGLWGDLIFLDILFEEELDGMTLAQHIRQKDEQATLVFTTQTDAYLRSGYAVRAFRYLKKPVQESDIALCLDVAYKQFALAHLERISIQDSKSRYAVLPGEILYISSSSPFTEIYLAAQPKPLRVRRRFSDIERMLPPDVFIRCHRCYTVNLRHVRRITYTAVTLSNGQEFPVARKHIHSLRSAFDTLYQEGGVLRVDVR